MFRAPTPGLGLAATMVSLGERGCVAATRPSVSRLVRILLALSGVRI